MKVLIIEDESLAADKLEMMLNDIDSSISIVAKLGSVKESSSWLNRNEADLIFLDIQLSDGISFSIFEQVAVNTPVIFTTAYDQYAVKAFKLNSISYLLKPVKRSDLVESLQKYKSMKSAFSIDFESLIATIRGQEPGFKKRFLIRIGEKIRKIEVQEVAYFYVLEKGVFIRTFQGSNYPAEYTLDRLETILDPSAFFRINRKYIVNMNSIVNMTAYSRGRIKLGLRPSPEDEADTIVSIDRSSEFRKWLDK